MDLSKEIQALVGAKKETILSSIKNVFVDGGKKFAIDFDFAFKKYLQRGYDKYSKVKTLLYRNEPRDLYDFFVCNNVKFRQDEIDCSSAQNILERSHFNILLGSGGTGKSIMMRHFFVSEIKQKDLIPLLLELRIYDGGSLEDCLYDALSNLGFSLEKEYFQYALRTGAFLLLFDGYDEILDNKKIEFYHELEKFCDRYPENWYIISSRQSESFIGWQRFTVFNIRQLSKEQAKELVEKLDYDEELKKKFIKNLDELYIKHKSFASNPLLLNIMLMTYDNFAEIPEKRHVFYANAFDALYAVHDAAKGGFKRDLKSSLSSDLFKKIFAEFCFASYLKGKVEFSEDDLLSLLECGKKYKEDFDPAAFFDDLQSAVCLIYKEGNTYLFTHRSFQEYFAALYIRDLSDSNQKEAYVHMLNIRNGAIDTDSILEMLLDMNPERFDCNFMIPFLEEVEKALPGGYGDEIQKRFLGYINAIEILCEKSDFGTKLKDTIRWNRGYIISQQKTMYICAVEFKKILYAQILEFIDVHYFKAKHSYRAQKGLTPYLERPYSATDVINDKALFDKIVLQTYLGQLLKASVGLLEKIKDRQRGNQSDFQKILEAPYANKDKE